MRFGSNNFNYFPENKLTKLVNFVQFIRMLMFCLKDWGGVWAPCSPSLGYPTATLTIFVHQLLNLLSSAVDGGINGLCHAEGDLPIEAAGSAFSVLFTSGCVN